MSRRYRHVIEMQQESEQGTPQRFVWRRQTYQVRAVWGSWHLRDRWWAGGEVGMPPASDRHYFRVDCSDGLLCEVYHDAVTDTWVLDRVLD